MSEGNGQNTMHERVGAHVIKRLVAPHPAGARFAAAMARGGATRLGRYLDALRSAGVRLADDMTVDPVEPLTVRHRWMESPVLLSAARTHPHEFVDAVETISSWVQALGSMDARVDTNLTNFCLTARGPVLVDVLPALVPSLRPAPCDLFDELLHSLCFDTSVILDALGGYALRALVAGDAGPGPLARMAKAVEGFAADGACATFPALWFRSRRSLAVRAATSEAPRATVIEFFELTSVLRFRDLDEASRRARILQVAERSEELSLP